MKIKHLIALASLASLVSTTALAANIIKANNTANLNLGSSWVGGVAPAAADIGEWNATVTSGNAVLLGADTNWLGLKVANPGGPVALGAGHTLTLGSGGIDMSAATTTLTLNCGVALGANQPWNVASGRTLAVGGQVSGAGGFTNAGPGTTIFSPPTAGNYTYAGPTVVAAGTLKVQGIPPVSSPVAGAVLWLDGADATTLFTDAAGTVPVTTSGDVVARWNDKSGNGNHVTLTGTQTGPTYEPGVALGQSVARFSSDTTCGMTTPVTVSSGNVSIFVVYAYRSAASAFRRAVQGSANWLMGPYNNTYQTYNGGWVPGAPAVVQDQFVLQEAVITSGGALTAYVNGTSYGTRTGVYPGKLYLGPGDETAPPYKEPLDGDIAEMLVYTSALSAADRANVETYLRAKWQGAPGPSPLPATTPVSLTSASAVLNLTNLNGGTIGSLSGVAGSQVLLGGAMLVAGDATTNTFAGVISGTGSLTEAGTGLLTLTGPNTYTGGTIINSGSTLQLGDGTVTHNELVGNITDNGALIFANPAAQAFPGNIGGSGRLTKSGAGTLTLSGTVNYTGPTTVNRGSLIYDVNNDLLSVGLSIANGATVEFNNITANQIFARIGGTISGGGTLRKNSSTVAYLSWDAGLTVAMASGGLIDINQGTLLLAYGGYVKSATNKADMTIASGATFDIWDSPSFTIDALTGSGTVIKATAYNGGPGMFTVGIDNGSGTFSGVLLDGTGSVPGILSLTKAGTGTQILSGANYYSGATIVSGGTLEVDSTLGTGIVTVQTNGTLRGVGTMDGAVEVQSGGILAPGTGEAMGTLTINNSLTLNAASKSTLRISKNGGAATSDLVTGMTGVTYNGTLQVANMTSDSTALALGDTFTLFTTVSGSYANGFANFILPPLPGGLSWDVSQLTVNGQISVSALTATPTFSPTAGGYVGAQVVAIRSLTAGATIYYTTDGSAPTLSSPSGTNGLTILVPTSTANITIQAFAHVTGSTDSGIASASYRTVVTPAWINTAGGSWPTAENWSNNIVADGSGMTADFSTLTLPADTTVTLDGARTIGKLVFDDRNATKHSWTLTTGSAGPLTLAVANGAPVISNNVPVTLDVELVGTQGLSKTGSGTNTISSTASYTGDTTVNNGRLVLQSMSTSWGNGGTVNLANGGTLEFNLATDWQPVITTMNVTGTGTLIKSGAGMMDVTWQFSAGLVMNLNTNAWIDVAGGTLRLGWGGGPGSNSWNGNLASLNIAGGAIIDTWDYNSNPVYVDALTGSGTVQHGWYGTNTLTVGVAGGSGTFSGTIQDGPGGAHTGGAGAVTMALTKTGGGTQILAGTNTYTGATIVSHGTMAVTGRLTGGGSVTLNDNATLNVTAHGANPTILTTGALTLGTTGAATLGFANLYSTGVAPISVSNLLVNSTVYINLTGGVQVGRLPLIKYSAGLAGSGAFTLGTLPAGVSATLVTNIVNQTLDLNVTAAPASIVLITDLPGTTAQRFAGAAASMFVVVGGNDLTYLWKRDGTPVGANSPTLAFSSLTTNDSGGYSVTVTNTAGSVHSATNYLVVRPASGYEAIVTATGPVAYWPLDELDGPTAVDYAGGYNGAYSSGGVTYGAAGPVGNPVVTLDGSSGNVSMPYTSALNPSGPFTVELWVNPTQVPFPGSVAYVASSVEVNGNRSGWYLAQDNGATFGHGSAFVARLFNQNGTTPTITLWAPVTASEWYYLTLAFDGTTAALYENGVLATSGTAGYVGNVDAPFTIGMRSDGAYSWPGSVGDVAVYGRALTPQEIQSHAANRPIITYAHAGANLILSWPTGSLQAAPEATGTYTNVPAATSPYPVTPKEARNFYRIVK